MAAVRKIAGKRNAVKMPTWPHLLTAVLAVVGTMTLRGIARSNAAEETGQRPNILYIMTDQQHAGMMSCAGNKHLKTPAMDGLAANGVRFARAYATNPVCLPARTSMMTGFMPSRFGIRSNAGSRHPIPESVLQCSMGWIFRDAGYETVYGGKTHWPKGMTPKSLGFRHITRNERRGLADACVRFLRTKREKPFLLVASFINPHDICYMAIDDYTRSAKRATMFPGSSVERERLAAALQLPQGVSREEFFRRLCPPLPENHEIPALEPECISNRYTKARSFRQFAREHWTDRQWRLHRWAYCRLTEMADAHIAKVLDALREEGLEKDTVIVFASDHGDLDGAHRLEHKSILYEEANRVPLIVSYKGVTRPGWVDKEHLVSVGLDLIPTMCDYAGIEPPPKLPGRSVRPFAEGRTPKSWRDQLVVESQNGRMLRTDRYKYVVYDSGEHREQLIDLANDPGEMKNLAEDPAFQNVLNDLRRRLRHGMQQSGDKIAEP